MSRKIVTLLFVFVLVVIFGMANAGEKLRVGNEADFPPFSQKDAAGNVVGFDPDIIEYVCKHMGVECEIVVQEWTGIIPALYAGKYDCIISSMRITEERKKKVLFAKPYYRVPLAFVARKDLNLEISREGLKGKTFCMFKQTSALPYLKEHFEDIIEIKYYDGAMAIKHDLLAGRCDCWFEAMPAVWGTILKAPEGKDFEFVGPIIDDPKWAGEGVGMAVKLGDVELAKKLNAAIDAMYADGTFKKINDKYFPFYLGVK